ncbi:hypothetical protein ABZ484_30340 [Streptomyces sp. NPDC006393]|uniref:hypothetical protein n=1 Tax=Streptomyces sp. NPDC006393 TaxID=3156763 RepID=UPI0033C615B5
MKVAQKLAAVGTAAIAVVCFSGGGAQAQDGGLLSLLNTPSITLACFPAGQVGQGNVFKGTQNVSCSQSASQTNPTPPTGGGITGAEVVTAEGSVPPGSAINAQADCPEGKVATGGGFLIGTTFTATPLGSYPTPLGANPPTGWAVAAQNASDTTSTFTVYAVCVDAVE